MYHVAICDDDRVFISYIKKILNQSKGDISNHFIFYEFYSGEDLIKSLDGLVCLDLLILDFKLGGIDGYETARLFRKKFKDEVLVFCSEISIPAVRSCKVTPYRYLLKSYSDVHLISEMKEILAEVDKKLRKEYIIGHYRNNIIKVFVPNILYIENAKRGSRVTVCPNSEEAKFEGDILVDDKLKMLSDRFFELVFAHRSYIININHIQKIVGKEVYLDNGESLSISKTYKEVLRESFVKNVSEKY